MRLLGMLAGLARSSDGLTLAELSQELKAPKSSLLTLLRPLVKTGHLTHTDGRYRLGPPVFRLASDILSGRKFPKLVRPYMDELAARTRETVILATIAPESRRAVYVEVVESAETVRYSVPVGTSRPLHASTAGRVLLAYQDRTWRDEFLRTEKLKPLTPRTITNRDVLRKELDAIVRQGYGVGFGQMIRGAAGLAAPLFVDGKVSAVLMIGAPLERLRDNLIFCRKALLEITARISGELSPRQTA